MVLQNETSKSDFEFAVQKRAGAKNKKATKHELRQLARARRKAEWEAFMATKRDNNYVSPDDAQAIIDATRNMGDYKLKSEKDYVPDEKKRMTPKRKKRQVLHLICVGFPDLCVPQQCEFSNNAGMIHRGGACDGDTFPAAPLVGPAKP
jgi:hypothetical protein